MKTVTLFIGLIAVGLGAGCFEKPSSTPGTAATVLYRHHFLGTAQLAHNTNAAQIPAILALPATRELTEQTLQKLARNPQELWRKFLPPGAAAQPTLVRPLLDDLVSAESYAEVHGPLQQSESVFAIELTDARAAVWRTNLGTILSDWKLGKPSDLTLGDAKGWEIKRTEAPTQIQFLRTGKWVLIGLGQEKLTLFPALLEQVQKNGRPIPSEPNEVLALQADCPRIGDWLPALTKAKLPPIHLTVTGKGEYLRTEGRLSFSDPLPLMLESWSIPTNFVRDPIVSFAVARGVAPLLSQVKGLAELGLNPLPNQFCAWGPATLHADTLFSVPTSNPSNLLYQIGPKLPDFTKGLLGQSFGGFLLLSNKNELVWGGWPILVPRLWPLREANTDFVLGQLLPIPLSTNPPPQGLFSQLNRPNLVYYDWELTQERLKQVRQLQQIWDIMHHRMLAPTNATDQKWLLTIAPELGNSITEVSLNSPKELTIVRKSGFGLTGFELASLARWLASPGFPWTFESPQTILSTIPDLPNSTNKAPSGQQKGKAEGGKQK